MADANELLDALRGRFAADSLESFAALESVWEQAVAEEPDPADSAGLGAHYELLAYDALIVERPGWAHVCMSAAAAHFARGRAEEDAQRTAAAAERILVESYAPYEDDAQLLADVRVWVRRRLGELWALDHRAAAALRQGDELAAPGSVVNAIVAARHEWMFRLVATHRLQRGLRVDALVDRLDLQPADHTLLLVLAALAGDALVPALEGGPGGGIGVGRLVELAADREEDAPRLVARLTPGAPLVASGVVHVLTPPDRPGAPLAERRASIDDVALAVLEARDSWPALLEDVARVVPPRDAPLDALLVAPRNRLDRALRQEDLEHGGRIPLILLTAANERAGQALARAYGAASRRTLIEVDLAGVPPREAGPIARALTLQANLRSALVWVGGLGTGHSRDALRVIVRRLEEAAANSPVPWLLDARLDDATLVAAASNAVEVRLEPPRQTQQVETWRAAIDEAGLPGLGEDELEALAEIPLHVDEVRRAVRFAANQAWLARAPGHALSVGADDLAAAARRLLEGR